jgi:DNA-binding CsgD family transcriptional regulator
MAEPTTQPPSPSAADIKARIEAERAGMPFLLWRDGDGAQQILMLEPELERVTIGRTSNSDIALPWDLEVSRTHALLERVGEDWTVIDDGLSRNGSFINGGRVRGRQRLHDRDRLVIGRTQMLFSDQRGDEEDSTARAGDKSSHVPLSERQQRILIALCRPVAADASAIPATNREIADELYLSVDAVKAHLRVLFERFELDSLPQNEKRVRLAHRALHSGLVHPHDF